MVATLRWMMSNVAIKQDPAGNIKPDKAKSTDRIDGVVAAIMAVGRGVIEHPVASAWVIGGRAVWEGTPGSAA